MNLMNLATIVFFGFMGLLAAGLLMMFRQRVAQQAEQQRIADATFEAEMLRNLSNASDSSYMPGALSGAAAASRPTSLADDEEIPAAGAETAAFKYQPAQIQPISSSLAEPPEDLYRQPADVVCAAIVQQLRNAGMVDETEGYLELNGNPKAAVILRMRGGKHALVIPYFESEPFALRNLRRYDMLIYMGRNGKAVAITSLEEVIASRVAGGMMQ